MPFSKIQNAFFRWWVVVSVVLGLAGSAQAAGIVPCGTDSTMCTLCDLFVGIHNIINWGFGVMVFVALAGITVAGVLYIVSAGDEGLKTTSKNLMKNVLIGFSLVLLAWVIVNTTLWLIGASDISGKLNVDSNSWWDFKCNS